MDIDKALETVENSITLTFKRPDYWINNTKHGFSEWATEIFKTQHRNPEKLLFHQQLVRRYLQPDSLFRGLLLYHGLGTGKTRSATGIAEALISSGSKERCIVLLPASLKNNFTNEIMKSNIMYKADKNDWKFFKKDELDDKRTKQLETFLGSDTINLLLRKQDGIYLPIKSSSNQISEEVKIGVEAQIKLMISRRYEFLHYNGLNKKLLQEYSQKTGFFDNKVIIIDEVHNLTSGLYKSKNSLKFKLYQELFKSNNSTFVLLSGTPIINEPVEIAYSVNLLRGKQTVYSITLTGMPQNMQQINEFKYIDMFTVKTNRKKQTVFSFSLVPKNFMKINGKIISNDTKDTRSYGFSIDILLGMVKKGLQSLKDTNGEKIGVMGQFEAKDNYALPIDKNEFDVFFVNTQLNTINLPNIFKRRVMGSISSYESSDKNHYPEQLRSEFYDVPMSSHQLKIYTEQREIEIQKEKNAAVKRDSDNNGVYKIFSRAICNFVFPEEIERPFPSKNRSLLMKEMDESSTEYVDIPEELNDTNDDFKKKYQLSVSKAIENLENEKDQYLKVDEGLDKLSPKYNLIIKNILNSEGTNIVYSDFRKVEGLRTLGICFEANGIGELKIGADLELKFTPGRKFYFAKFGEGNNDGILLKIFNNDIRDLPEKIRLQIKNRVNLEGRLLKALMITRSGAEGISLKNVRHVHIVEPYWNNIRIDQVIGRANRLNSHKALPVNKRNFKVHHYCSIFSENAKINSLVNSIKNKDKSLTSDQMIRNIAKRKEKLIEDFLKALRQASIDCEIHKNEENCLKSPDYAKDTNENAFSFNIEEEFISVRPTRIKIQGTTTRSKTEQSDAFIIQFKKGSPKSLLRKKFIYNPETNTLYDYNRFTNPNTLGSKFFIGTMKKITKDQYFISILNKQQP
tara:strand:- start:832 stop:3561 length:2730 start_codon:yes stop_codon:yes gene_type:complete